MALLDGTGTMWRFQTYIRTELIFVLILYNNATIPVRNVILEQAYVDSIFINNITLFKGIF
jgi:hypothetical protein